VTDPNAVTNLTLVQQNLDVLVNCIGTVEYGRKEYEPTVFDSVINTNLNSIMAICTKYKSHLSERGGNIVNIGSIASLRATIGNPAYSASKAGLMMLTQTLAKAWAHKSIRVNMVAPGFVETKLTQITHENQNRKETVTNTIPLGRWGTPEEIGKSILFLSSPMASYISGATLTVDGGFLC